ncbi:MAG TPA: hypothetical protein DCE55_19565 [Planctomycetaceae bacterium]|nr:hypothetical protein [Planctomycetaceae bacterium]
MRSEIPHNKCRSCSSLECLDTVEEETGYTYTYLEIASIAAWERGINLWRAILYFTKGRRVRAIQ